MNTSRESTNFDVLARWVLVVALFGSGVLSLIKHQQTNAIVSLGLSIFILLLAVNVLRPPKSWGFAFDSILMGIWALWICR